MEAPDPASTKPSAERWSPWLTSWSALGLPGLCLALVMWGAATVAGMAAAVALTLAVVLVLSGDGHRQWDGGPSAKVDGGWITHVVACGVILVLSIVATGAFVPALGFLLLVLACASTPPAVDIGRRMWGPPARRHHPASAERIAPLPRPGTVRAVHEVTAAAMTDAQLCRAWRHSYWLLRESRDPAARLTIVRTRHGILDELETRNPAVFEAWLASEPRPSQGPDHFLSSGEGGDQATAA